MVYRTYRTNRTYRTYRTNRTYFPPLPPLPPTSTVTGHIPSPLPFLPLPILLQAYDKCLGPEHELTMQVRGCGIRIRAVCGGVEAMTLGCLLPLVLYITESLNFQLCLTYINGVRACNPDSLHND